ncbi:MAG TPA: RNA methyltransferase [Gammaproteobacteria bacterium]|jgi:tRNA (cytidine32/uridine32-2'-O)-methyltransferase
MHKDLANRIRIVMVETSHPGNIGAAARAMKTMCLTDLVLVSPLEFPHADASARASGAVDLLERARVVKTLDEALAGCTLVAGTSARQRGLGPPVLAPRECLARVHAAAAAGQETALVFGRERIGLTNEELGRCHILVNIPSNPDYSSLNIAAAVQVLGYEWMLAQGIGPAAGENEDKPATAEEMEKLFEHMETAALETGFLDPANPKHLMRRIRRLFHRAQPDQNEVHILRGLFSALQKPKPPRRGNT